MGLVRLIGLGASIFQILHGGGDSADPARLKHGSAGRAGLAQSCARLSAMTPFSGMPSKRIAAMKRKYPAVRGPSGAVNGTSEPYQGYGVVPAPEGRLLTALGGVLSQHGTAGSGMSRSSWVIHDESVDGATTR